jgi:hypothetical protein
MDYRFGVRDDEVEVCSAWKLILLLRTAIIYIFFFSRGSTTLVGLGLLFEVPRAHSDTTHSVKLLCMSDRPVA